MPCDAAALTVGIHTERGMKAVAINGVSSRIGYETAKFAIEAGVQSSVVCGNEVMPKPLVTFGNWLTLLPFDGRDEAIPINAACP